MPGNIVPRLFFGHGAFLSPPENSVTTTSRALEMQLPPQGLNGSFASGSVSLINQTERRHEP